MGAQTSGNTPGALVAPGTMPEDAAELRLPWIQNEYRTQLIFHDFDYVDAENKQA